MPTVSPSQSNPGDEITAAAINNPINQLAAVVNGNIDATNIADNAVSTAKIANTSVTPTKMNLTKTTDANGWTVYDYGTWKEYRKVVTGGAVGGSGSGILTNIYSAQNIPAGIVPNDLHWTFSIIATGFASQAVINIEFSHTATTSSTWSAHAFRLTGSDVVPVAVAVRAITK